MKIAYIIAAHKNSEQLKLLINKLDYKDNDLYIHIDLKNEKLFYEIDDYTRKYKNIILIKNRINVNWSGFSQVQATINSMKEIVESGINYDYISFISGQDFPIKSNEYISNFLQKNYGKEFMEYRDVDECDLFRLKVYNLFREYKNIRKTYMRVIDNILRRVQKPIIKRNNFININLFHGSSWFTITHSCMKYILNYLDRNPEYLKDFKYTLCPDEHFFQMIVLNSKFKENVKNDNLRYIDWNGCRNSPRTLNITDLDKIEESDKLIARKFDIETDKHIIDLLLQKYK